MSLLEHIKSIELAHRKVQEALDIEGEYMRPILTDTEQIGEIYAIFADELPKYSTLPLDCVESRRIFELIIARLYCPATFVGKKLRKGVRTTLAKVMNCEASLISHDFKNLTFHYKKYRDYRETVDAIYNGVMMVLGE